MAQDYHVIKIVLDSDGGGEGSAGSAGVNQTTDNNVPSKSLNKDNLKLIGGGALVARQTFNFVSSNVGTYTGSSRTQENVNNAMKMAGHAAHIAISPVTGIAALGMDIALTEVSRKEDIKQRQEILEMQRFRLNYNSKNRSRG